MESFKDLLLNAKRGNQDAMHHTSRPDYTSQILRCNPVCCF